MPLGRTIGYTHPSPERTASRTRGLFTDVEFQVWPNRQSMARSVRMQQQGEPRPDHWRPVVKLTDGEGY